MKKTTHTTTCFDIGFYVEVSPYTDKDGKEMYDFFLCKKNYGIKQLMFGLYASDCPPNEWEMMIESTVYDHIKLFIKEMEESEIRFLEACQLD